MPPRESEHYTTSGKAVSDEAPLLAACRHLLQPNGSIIGNYVADAVLPRFPTFASAIPSSDRPALASIDGRSALSHQRIANFVNEFGSTLHALGLGKGNRIALVLPNGPELALAIVATSQWASCVPLSANGAITELEADLLRCGADLVIGPYSGVLSTAHLRGAVDERFHVTSSNDKDWSAFRCIEETASKLKIPFVGLVPSPAESGIFHLQSSRLTIPLHFDEAEAPKKLRGGVPNRQPNGADDEILVLFTSGTTGSKKLVPHLMGDMLTAAATIALSWDLTPSCVNCNLMPLFHVGGIVRQVFSPIFSAGCVICCPSFDPSIFWTLLEKQAFTWYYAAPTMHQLILQTGRSEGYIKQNGACDFKLTMIANAAGGLLPSLALEMMNTFGANVLPSYGMTECMPISSPPASYRLQKPGTSGVAVGPEVAILNTSTMKPLAIGEEGPICVRGQPCFRGYGQLANALSQKIGNSFLRGGWFNTGDLGYLDEDGYLFITGRSKEVINRGGEIISPMEVEEAVSSHPDIATCAAFSAMHNVLQEVVGIVIVMDADRPRLDLPSLHEFLGERLAAPKWPQCIVFTDGLPRSHTNKLLRVKLGRRFQLPELSDGMNATARTFEAACPPQGTPLDTPIPATSVALQALEVEKELISLVREGSNQGLVVLPHPKRVGSLVCYLHNVERRLAINHAIKTIHRYAVPTHFVEIDEGEFWSKKFRDPKTTDAVASILQSEASGPVDPLTQEVKDFFAEMLDLDYIPGPDANFFHLGGSSMLASQLASKIRKRFSISFGGSEVFQYASPKDMANIIRQRSDNFTTSTASDESDSQDGSTDSKNLSNHGAPFELERMPLVNTFASKIFQFVPMFGVFPIWQITRYLLFFCLLLWCVDNVPGNRDLPRFIFAYLLFHTCWITLTPLIFVLIKWTVIGRYQPGRYPIWGSYYWRWWFVDVCRKLFLRGIWGSNDVLLNSYYRLLGAKVGRNARISLECEVAEFDLVEIGDEAALEFSTVRGFGVDNGAMILGPVKIGRSASVGMKSVVAPYTSIPDNGHLGAVSSSYEIGKALRQTNARVNRCCITEPCAWMQVFAIAPITFLVNAFGQIPPLLVLFIMLRYKGDHDISFSTLSDLMAWLCDRNRIPFFIGIRVARGLLSPFFYMAAAIAVKKTIIGTFTEGPRENASQWQLFRHSLSATLFSRKKIQEVTDLIGRHYELVSVLYRLLGAKVGRRVFWPGHQPVFSAEFDLLEVGDDVVFGSRSSFLFTTVDSVKKVTLCAGSNVADNCAVFPGAIIGKNAVLGSNSVCPEDWYLPERSVWLGSKGCEPTCLEKGVDIEVNGPILASQVKRGSLPLVGDASTLRPFGKAFYMKKANYGVWSVQAIVAFSAVTRTFIVAFHTLPLLGALHGAAAFLYGWSFAERDYVNTKYPFSTIYFSILSVYFVSNLVRVSLWLVVELSAKWSLMGRRAEGRYNYDSSSYAQRWELYQLVAKVRKFSRLNFLDFFSGTPFMSTYFRWNGGHIGKDCCLYPAGADPFMPEPDLVFMGDRCVVDCASVVCHLNTRGNFELTKIVIDNDCTLRCRSRVQQGVHMEERSQLLEKSLAMTGEVIDAYSVWQGDPASWWFQYDQQQEDPSVFDESSKLLQGNTSYYNE